MPRKKSTPSRRTAAVIKPIYRRDKLFKVTSTSLNIHKEIVRRYLPKKLLSRVDVDQVRVMNSVSVDTHLRERLADLALEMPFKTGTGTCCVCIEQQTDRPFSADRMLHYQLRSIKAICKEKGEDHPVAVCTIVLKSGRSSDKQKTDLFAGLHPDDRQAAREALGMVYVVALGDIPDEQLNDGSAIGILLMLLKHRRGRRILPILEKIWDNFKHLKETPQGQEFVETALTYALLAGRKDEKHGIMKEIGRHLGQQEEGSVMTVASALKQRYSVACVKSKQSRC